MTYRPVWSALQGTTSTEWILVAGSLLTWIVTPPFRAPKAITDAVGDPHPPSQVLTLCLFQVL